MINRQTRFESINGLSTVWVNHRRVPTLDNISLEDFIERMGRPADESANVVTEDRQYKVIQIWHAD